LHLTLINVIFLVNSCTFHRAEAQKEDHTVARVEAYLERHYAAILVMLALGTILCSLRDLQVGNLQYFTLRGAIEFWEESAQYERLMDAAAFSGKKEALEAAERCSRPTVGFFALQHPEFVRPGADISGLKYWRGTLPPLPSRGNATSTAK